MQKVVVIHRRRKGVGVEFIVFHDSLNEKESFTE